MRIGHGYDVHKFAENRKLIIGGTEIPFELGLLGHSDADVLVHAIMDALLGAAALGDIGKLFPDTDEKYKGADSILLLKEVCRVLADYNYRIVNIDSTVIAQQPKLKPHIDEMRKNIANACGIDISLVSVKATTEEKLGFTGRLEGISAHAVCLLSSTKSYSFKKCTYFITYIRHLVHINERGVFMLRKAFVSITLCAVLLMSPFVGLKVNALSADSISAPSAVLMESSTGKVLFEKNPHEQRPCASVTKVMTLLLVFEAVDSGKLSLDDEITASEHAAGMGGSDIWLEKGETMSADDMIKATVVVSANDAAVALAEHISGSEDAFVEKMNSRAKELGMNDTVFKNCNGLDEEGHITSAYDVALMSRELTKHEKIFDYTSIWLDNLRGGKTQIVNTNKLLKTYNGITGLKTGTTNDAGCCMSATATRGDVSLISVVLGCKTGKERFADAAALLDYGFANVSVKELTL